MRTSLILIVAVVVISCSGSEEPSNGQDVHGQNQIDLDAGPEEVFEGELDAEGDAVDEETGTDDVDDDGGIDADAGDVEDSLYVEGAPPQGTDHLRVGTGIEGYQPLHQGDRLTWEQGMQGGFHIWGSFRADGPPFSELSAEEADSIFQDYSLYDQEGELVATTNRFGFVDLVDDGLESGGFTVILRRTMRPNEVLDGPYELILTLTLGSGEEYESRVWVYLECCDYL